MADIAYEWGPLSPAEIADVFTHLSIPWWIAGGEAIDMFIGRRTRHHGDLDIAVLRRDVPALKALRVDWDVHIAKDGELIPWDGTLLPAAVHQLWVRRWHAPSWAFEILFEETSGDDWLFRRDHRVRRPVKTLGRSTESNIPCLAPEICLLYKARGHEHMDVQRRVKHESDFAAALPLLPSSSQRWLHGALETTEPGHPWLMRLAAS
jgi:hypothetical protein